LEDGSSDLAVAATYFTGRFQFAMDSTMTTILITLATFMGAFVITTTSQAEEPLDQRGRTFAQTNCASCHEIGPTGESPLRIAPPFRTLHLRYPIEDLEESLAEGIRTAHPAMPQFQLDSAQIGDLIAYLKALERWSHELDMHRFNEIVLPPSARADCPHRERR
jgi:mono/diheme cytochrome c family protein